MSFVPSLPGLPTCAWPLLRAGALVLAAGLPLAAQSAPPREAADPAHTGAPDPRLDPTVRAIARIAPAVVNVAARDGQGHPQSLGSGVVIHEAGLVLTNAHVVEDARARGSTIRVYQGGRAADAVILAASPTHDLALLRTDLEVGASATLATDAPLIGQTCLAIGNPFGLDHSVSRGVVSARGRRLKVEGRLVPGTFLQTDAAINPGNSGGPLIDLRGQVIGLTTATRKGGHGIGFAIPARRLSEALRWLSDPERLLDRDLGATLEEGPRGPLIASLDPRGPAARAGLRPGDQLVTLGPRAVSSVFEAQVAALLSSELGLRVAYLRGERRGGATLLMTRSDASRQIWRRLGLRLRDLDADLAWRRGTDPGGVLVDEVAPRSAAGALGLEPGDRLHRYSLGGAGGQDYPLPSRRALAELLGGLPRGARLELTLRRQGRDYQGSLTLP